MRTSVEKGEALRIHHHSDWSGEVEVAWKVEVSARRNGETHKTEEFRSWKIDEGTKLVKGTVKHFVDTTGMQVPTTVVARAVALASSAFLRDRVETLLEDVVEKL